MRDGVDRLRFLGNWKPASGHFNGPRYHLNGVIAQNRAIDSVTSDLLSSQGRKKAKEQFVAATEWASKRGAKVMLLAAGLKHLFGKDGGVLKERFPTLIFTLGDNGTAFLLRNEIFHACDEAGLLPTSSKIVVLGPYGLLGESVTQALCGGGYTVIGAGPNAAGLDRVAKDYGIETCQTFDDIGKVDAVVACTHSDKMRMTADIIDRIRRKDRRLLVIDVAEPSNLTEDEFRRCNGNTVRQDAGNAYSPNLKYVLGAISYRMFRLTRGVTFGCFAEAMSLASSVKRGEEWVKDIDWFQVNEDNMKRVEEMFTRDGFTIPSPRCFGKPVDSFALEIK
jgi:predicted amino acid dehydrogenase